MSDKSIVSIEDRVEKIAKDFLSGYFSNSIYELREIAKQKKFTESDMKVLDREFLLPNGGTVDVYFDDEEKMHIVTRTPEEQEYHQTQAMRIDYLIKNGYSKIDVVPTFFENAKQYFRRNKIEVIKSEKMGGMFVFTIKNSIKKTKKNNGEGNGIPAEDLIYSEDKITTSSRLRNGFKKGYITQTMQMINEIVNQETFTEQEIADLTQVYYLPDGGAVEIYYEDGKMHYETRNEKEQNIYDVQIDRLHELAYGLVEEIILIDKYMPMAKRFLDKLGVEILSIDRSGFFNTVKVKPILQFEHEYDEEDEEEEQNEIESQEQEQVEEEQEEEQDEDFERVSMSERLKLLRKKGVKTKKISDVIVERREIEESERRFKEAHIQKESDKQTEQEVATKNQEVKPLQPEIKATIETTTVSAEKQTKPETNTVNPAVNEQVLASEQLSVNAQPQNLQENLQKPEQENLQKPEVVANNIVQPKDVQKNAIGGKITLEEFLKDDGFVPISKGKEGAVVQPSVVETQVNKNTAANLEDVKSIKAEEVKPTAVNKENVESKISVDLSNRSDLLKVKADMFWKLQLIRVKLLIKPFEYLAEGSADNFSVANNVFSLFTLAGDTVFQLEENKVRAIAVNKARASLVQMMSEPAKSKSNALVELLLKSVALYSKTKEYTSVINELLQQPSVYNNFLSQGPIVDDLIKNQINSHGKLMEVVKVFTDIESINVRLILN